MLKWLYLNISFKSFITLPWACPVNWSVTKSPILYLHSFSHLLPWRVSKSKFDFASFWTVRKPYLFGAFEFEFEKFCVQQYWFTVCRFDFFWNDFITWYRIGNNEWHDCYVNIGDRHLSLTASPLDPIWMRGLTRRKSIFQKLFDPRYSRDWIQM